MLCVMNDLGFKEAAEMTGLPVGTIARLARARARLRERMLKKVADLQQREGMDGDQARGRTPSGRAEEAGPAETDEEEPDRAEEASS